MHHEQQPPECGQVLACEAQLRSAMLASNLSTLDVLLADDLVFVTPTGAALGKAESLELCRSGQLQLTRLDVDHREIRSVAPAIEVSVDVTLEGTCNGGRISGRYSYTRNWVRRAGQWQILRAFCIGREP